MLYEVFARVLEYPSTKVEALTPQKAQEIAEERCGADYEWDDNAEWSSGYVQDENGNIVLDERPRIIPGILYLYKRYDDRDSYPCAAEDIYTTFGSAYVELKKAVIEHIGDCTWEEFEEKGRLNEDDTFSLFDINEQAGFAYVGVNEGDGTYWFCIERKEVK